MLVVRGDDLNPDAAKGQAAAFRRRFPAWHRFGLPAYYARSDAEIDDLAADQLERFPVLVVLSIDRLIETGFEVVPTFRTLRGSEMRAWVLTKEVGVPQSASFTSDTSPSVATTR